MKIEELTVSKGSSLSKAMEVISREGSGICFVVNELFLLGVITDGDIRRALLSGADLNTPVEKVMKKNYFSLSVNASVNDIQKHIGNYKNIPIVNNLGQIVDLATPSRYHQIPLIQPLLDGSELEYVTDCIMTGWVSSQGKYVDRFESDFREYVGAANSLAVSNGTVALHLALVALGIGPGDEVLIPNLTFAAPANSILYVGATPVFVDVDPVSMAINPLEVERLITKNTRAIIAVHLYGHPASMDVLLRLAKAHNLYIIEDCAEALGSRYQGLHVGLWGDVATFSFFGNKTITTGEGGMVLFKDPNLHKKAKILRDHGMSPEKRYWHNEVGFNYRLTNLQAALGVAQLERIDYFVDRKRAIANQYNLAFNELPQLQLPQDGGDVYNSYWLYTLALSQDLSGKRNAVLNFLKAKGIEARPVFFPLHTMPPYMKYSGGRDYPVSEWLSEGGISLPSSVNISDEEVTMVCECLNEALSVV